MKCFIRTKREKIEFIIMIVFIISFALLLSYEFLGNGLTNEPNSTFIIDFLIASALMISITWLQICYILRN